MVSVQYLSYFMKICQTRSMNRAAEELYISQPALSLAMKNLEKELDVTLFVRSNRGIELTSEGERLLKHTRLIMGQLELLENFGHEEKHELSISAFPCLIPANVLLEYKQDKEYGDSFIDYQECRVGQIIDNVYNSVSDMGVLQYNDRQISALARKLKPLNLELEEIAKNDWCVVVGKNSPLYGAQTVNLDELVKYRQIRQKDDYFSYMTSEIKTDSISLDDLQCDWISSSEMTGALLENTDMYVFAASQPHFMNLTEEVYMIPIADPRMQIHVGWIKKRNVVLSDEAEAFIRLLKKEFIQMN